MQWSACAAAAALLAAASEARAHGWCDEDEEPPTSALADPSERAELRALVERLRDTDELIVSGNHLDEFWGRQEEAAPWLRVALQSTDRRQRQLAAFILRDGTRKPACDGLLRASVEALEDDAHWVLRPGEVDEVISVLLDAGGLDEIEEVRAEGIPVPNATDSIEWFLQEPNRIRLASPLLTGMISSPDPQACFLSAYLLARVGGGGCRECILPIMLASLEDNEVWGDATLAMQALAWLGPDALPDLRARLLKSDAQSELLIRHVIAKVAGPDDPDGVRLTSEVLEELGFQRGDPLVESEHGTPDVRVPIFPAAWTCVPYRATLHALPAVTD